MNLSIAKKFCFASLKDTHLGIIFKHWDSISALFDSKFLYESSLKILNILKIWLTVVSVFPSVIEKNKL